MKLTCVRSQGSGVSVAKLLQKWCLEREAHAANEYCSSCLNRIPRLSVRQPLLSVMAANGQVT